MLVILKDTTVVRSDCSRLLLGHEHVCRCKTEKYQETNKDRLHIKTKLLSGTRVNTDGPHLKEALGKCKTERTLRGYVLSHPGALPKREGEPRLLGGLEPDRFEINGGPALFDRTNRQSALAGGQFHRADLCALEIAVITGHRRFA